MTGPRGKWKPVARLKAGEVEQYAVVRSYGTVTITLSYDPVADLPARDIEQMPWTVQLSIQQPGQAFGIPSHEVEVQSWRSHTLDPIRKKFTELVRKHP
jgi:hypothetical protein